MALGDGEEGVLGLELQQREEDGGRSAAAAAAVAASEAT